MLAAIGARRGAEGAGIECSITIFERNARTGTKIRISGGGKCNVTHQGTPAELLEAGFLRINEQRFLRNALYGFSNNDLLELLHSRGVVTEVRPDGKVFPLSEDASSVAMAFEELLKELSVQLISSCRVKSVERKDGSFMITTTGEPLSADVVILATGGVSYSKTGTTGDGLVIARKLGHSIKEPSAALGPVFTLKAPPASLSGVSLRSAGLVVSAGGKSIERRGDLLFTHRGFSGPAALSLSRDIAELCREFGSALSLLIFFLSTLQLSLINCFFCMHENMEHRWFESFCRHARLLLSRRDSERHRMVQYPPLLFLILSGTLFLKST